MATKKIGVLTSGGDCAGLNAAIRAVVQRAVDGHGWEVVGILDATRGLLARPPAVTRLDLQLFDGTLLRMGGTILGTVNSGDPFAYPMPDGSRRDRSDEVIAGLHFLELDALIGIGGDGSLRILTRLAEQGGFQFIGIPKTIDNDVPLTEFSIGFATAVSTASEALDRLQPTAASHRRVMILEVMGRDAGHIALNAGIAGGADVILIPEIPYDIDKVAAKIEALRRRGRNHALVVCAEAARPVGGRGGGGGKARRRRAVRRSRPSSGRGNRPGDGRRNPRHGAGPCAARRHAVESRPDHRVGLRRACRGFGGCRQVGVDGRLAEQGGGGRASEGRGFRPGTGRSGGRSAGDGSRPGDKFRGLSGAKDSRSRPSGRILWRWDAF